MPNQIGDIIRKGYRGSVKNVEWEFDRGGGATWYSVMPSTSSGNIFEEIPQVDRGIDGKVDEKWFEYRLRLEFMQVDSDTLADLYSGALDPLLRTTGMPTRITLATGQEIELTMRYTKRFIASGPQSYSYVELIGVATVGVSVFQ